MARASWRRKSTSCPVPPNTSTCRATAAEVDIVVAPRCSGPSWSSPSPARSAGTARKVACYTALRRDVRAVHHRRFRRPAAPARSAPRVALRAAPARPDRRAARAPGAHAPVGRARRRSGGTRRCSVGGQTRTEARLGALAEAQTRTDEQLATLTARVDTLVEAQTRTERRVAALDATVGGLKGEALELRYARRAGAYFSPLARRLQILDHA